MDKSKQHGDKQQDQQSSRRPGFDQGQQGKGQEQQGQPGQGQGNQPGQGGHQQGQGQGGQQGQPGHGQQGQHGQHQGGQGKGKQEPWPNQPEGEDREGGSERMPDPDDKRGNERSDRDAGAGRPVQLDQDEPDSTKRR